jgi:hypothetical protein
VSCYLTDNAENVGACSAPDRQAPPLLLPTCHQGRLKMAVMLVKDLPVDLLEV